MSDISVAISSIPPRSKLLRRAIASVLAQTLSVRAIAVEVDHDRRGAAWTKNAALSRVDSEWVGFLDDDDALLPHHLERLRAAAEETGADVVYSLPLVLDANDLEIPRQWDWGGGPIFDPELLKRKAFIQTTCLVKSEWAKKVGGFEFVTDETGAVNDDHGFFLKLLEAGAKFHHVHEQTFVWRIWGHGTRGVPGNTSGQPSRW